MKTIKNNKKSILFLSFALVLAVFFGVKFGIAELNAAENNVAKADENMNQIKIIAYHRNPRIDSPHAVPYGMIALKKDLKVEDTLPESSGVTGSIGDSLAQEELNLGKIKKVVVIDSNSLIIEGPIINIPR